MKRRSFLGELAAAPLAPFAAPLLASGRPRDAGPPRRRPEQPRQEPPKALPWDDIRPLPPETRARYTDLARIRGDIVPNDEFFVLDHFGAPELPTSGFRLRVGRAGEEPRRELALEEIRALPRREPTIAFECCGNGGVGMHGLVGAARWTGTPLRPLLDGLVGPDAREVVFFGMDAATESRRGNLYPSRFARSLPIGNPALDPWWSGVLLAYGMNGAPLPREHGGPLRLVVPGHYGVAHVKWLSRIEVWSRRFLGHYQARDYTTVRGVPTSEGVVHVASSIGPMRLKSLVTRVERAAAGSRDLILRGLAWNDGETPVERVEVRVDEGGFVPARLLPTPHRYGLRRFEADWPAPAPGVHRLTSRAVDARGAQPTDEEASRYKATPWENDGQVVRRIRL